MFLLNNFFLDLFRCDVQRELGGDPGNLPAGEVRRPDGIPAVGGQRPDPFRVGRERNEPDAHTGRLPGQPGVRHGDHHGRTQLAEAEQSLDAGVGHTV